MAGALWSASEQRPDSQAEQEELDHEDGDCGVVGEALWLCCQFLVGRDGI
jgi:hypothetical protein